MDGNETKDNQLDKEIVERYCRQIILPEISAEGQKRINNAKVIVIGAGGLGSPCLMYLAGAGVGTIGIVDGDCVDTSNLHRQIIHATSCKGVNKAKSAELLVKAFNPLVNTIVYNTHLTSKNAIEICKNYDLIIDCCDNPATRYLTSDVAVFLNIPLVSGSAVKWEGQLTIYVRDSINNDKDFDNNNSNNIPCYRCLFPKPTPAGAVCNCSDSGVFGPVPGVIGTMQANEAIKLIIGASDKILAKKMLMYDAYEMTFKVFKLRPKKVDCESCVNRNNIDITNYDYEEFVNPQEFRIPKRLELAKENEITWTEFKEKISTDNNNIKLIDVRSNEQFGMFKLKEFDFENIPLQELILNFNENITNKENQIFIMCRAGNQSTHAVKMFLDKGFKNVFNLKEGLHGYRNELNEKIPFY